MIRYALIAVVGMGVLSGCGFVWQDIYCIKWGGDAPSDAAICTDEDETWMMDADLSKLRGKKVPSDWGRVKIGFRPFRPINGKSVWPLWGYTLERYDSKYNDGTAIQ